MSAVPVIPRARGHLRAILLAWMFVALSGLALAWPAAAGVGREFRGSPDGDAPLFKPGALDLLDYLWRARGVISADLGHFIVLFPLALVTAVVPLAVLLAAIGGVSRSQVTPHIGRMLGVLVAFDIGALVLQVVTVWAAFALAAITAAGLSASLGEKRSSLCGAAVLALGVLLVITLSIVRDLSSAAAVGRSSGILRSLGATFDALDREGVSLVWAWLWRTSIGFSAIALATVLATKIGGKSGVFLLVLTTAHQAALGWKVAWRASWLAASLRAIAPLRAAPQAADDDETASER